MFSIFSDEGLFGLAMGTGKHEPSEDRLAAIQNMVDSEDELERLLDRAYRTEPQPGDSGPILASILNSWRVVRRAREAAGY